MTSRREHNAQASAAAAIARAAAHVPPVDDWPEPIPVDARPERYPVTPDIARAIRIEIEESHLASEPRNP